MPPTITRLFVVLSMPRPGNYAPFWRKSRVPRRWETLACDISEFLLNLVHLHMKWVTYTYFENNEQLLHWLWIIVTHLYFWNRVIFVHESGSRYLIHSRVTSILKYEKETKTNKRTDKRIWESTKLSCLWGLPLCPGVAISCVQFNWFKRICSAIGFTAEKENTIVVPRSSTIATKHPTMW